MNKLHLPTWVSDFAPPSPTFPKSSTVTISLPSKPKYWYFGVNVSTLSTLFIVESGPVKVMIVLFVPVPFSKNNPVEFAGFRGSLWIIFMDTFPYKAVSVTRRNVLSVQSTSRTDVLLIRSGVPSLVYRIRVPRIRGDNMSSVNTLEASVEEVVEEVESGTLDPSE